MVNPTGARLLVQALKAAGTDVIFTLSGNQILPIYDVCLDEGIRLIDTRHESAAAHMADAYARVTGRPAVCLVTAGPGHTNALTGLGTAFAAESPVLLLSGGSERARAGSGAFQELDQASMAAPIAKAAAVAESVAELPERVARLFRIMQGGRPGPAYLTLPADILTATSDREAAVPPAEAFRPEPRTPDSRVVAQAVEWLAQSERPLVLGGPAQAWGTAGEAFQTFLEATGVPGFVLESPRGLSDPALHGLGSAFQEADLVILLARQDFVAGFARPAVMADHGRLVQVTPDAGEQPRNREPDLSMVGDAARVLERLRQAVEGSATRQHYRDWAAALAERRTAQQAGLAAAETADDRPLHPLRVCAEVRQRLDRGDVVAMDGGEFGQWARWSFGGSQQRVLLNGKFGMIGCGIPFATGARLAVPEGRVVAFLGDGTFGFHGFEFDTAVRHNLPFVAIVGNDTAWAAERHRQVAIYGPDRVVAADLLETRYDEVARALGADGALVERPKDLGPALDRAFASGRPTCLNVRIASIPSPAAVAG